MSKPEVWMSPYGTLFIFHGLSSDYSWIIEVTQGRLMYLTAETQFDSCERLGYL